MLVMGMTVWFRKLTAEEAAVVACVDEATRPSAVCIVRLDEAVWNEFMVLGPLTAERRSEIAAAVTDVFVLLGGPQCYSTKLEHVAAVEAVPN